jgi:hypothetical protein
MTTFTVTLTETTIKRTYIEVEAEDWEQAEDLASKEYYEGSTEWHYEDSRIEMDTEEEGDA